MLRKYVRLSVILFLLVVLTSSVVPVGLAGEEEALPVYDTGNGQLALFSDPVEGVMIEDVAGLSVVTDYSVFDNIKSLSVDGVRPSRIFGDDLRRLVKNPYAFPNSAVVLLVAQYEGDPGLYYAGTGWMFGPTSIATSAWYVYHPTRGMATNIFVYGYGMTKQMNHWDPASKGAPALWESQAVGWAVPQAWVNALASMDINTLVENDYAFLALQHGTPPDVTITYAGHLTGWLGFRFKVGYTDPEPPGTVYSSVFKSKIWLLSYPWDKNEARVANFNWFSAPWQMWKTSSDKPVWRANTAYIVHRLDVGAEDYGSPLYQDYNPDVDLDGDGDRLWPCARSGGPCTPTAVAIHTDWAAAAGILNGSTATRITADVFMAMIDWRTNIANDIPCEKADGAYAGILMGNAIFTVGCQNGYIPSPLPD